LSESARVFDSELLKDIIEELSDQLPNVSRIPGQAVVFTACGNRGMEKAMMKLCGF
jgi:hypothetical protein